MYINTQQCQMAMFYPSKPMFGAGAGARIPRVCVFIPDNKDIRSKRHAHVVLKYLKVIAEPLLQLLTFVS